MSNKIGSDYVVKVVLKIRFCRGGQDATGNAELNYRGFGKNY